MPPFLAYLNNRRPWREYVEQLAPNNGRTSALRMDCRGSYSVVRAVQRRAIVFVGVLAAAAPVAVVAAALNAPVAVLSVVSAQSFLHARHLAIDAAASYFPANRFAVLKIPGDFFRVAAFPATRQGDARWNETRCVRASHADLAVENLPSADCPVGPGHLIDDCPLDGCLIEASLANSIVY
jgi:hypothetical protein